ncbi:uncharacterized protein PV06_00471 [Exophiala oligosperma]|uniref:Uncharacterized protein n=1 Tax=Exophiala oligosperma TaxID=215243 RepID=A0A0D2EIP0_9EURO|nr:uncharacterized protein PV06_00471 [Exophiala oligosperma]KIW47809.1 hypothetical protein PV06_00471 [Exophiala oligosperma]
MAAPDAKKLAKFIQAMDSTYGRFPEPNDPNLSQWVPPPAAEGHRGRYLWTDGFAVVNFLTLYKITGETQYLTFATNLVTAVHDVLGYTRDGKQRLPGATDDDPLGGGLRIGKHDESGPDGDGQYFHYLTVWMFALNRMSLVTGNKWYNDQAVSMAKAALPHFMTNASAERPRMFWKVSMDLSHRLVNSEGNLDPIDGYVTYSLLQQLSDNHHVLDGEISALKKIVDQKAPHYSTHDTLDIGMTLWTAHWLVPEPAWPPEQGWASQLQYRTLQNLIKIANTGYFDRPLESRLAFREFGTALGVHAALPLLDKMRDSEGSKFSVESKLRTLPDQICEAWEDFGLVPVLDKDVSQRLTELMPITAVMYATALIPGLMIRQP